MIAPAPTPAAAGPPAEASAGPPPRVWLLTNAPSPYQEELFAEVRRQGRLDLRVRYLRGDSSSAPGAGARQGTVLRGVGLSRDELRYHPDAARQLRADPPDAVVLSGLYTSPTFLRLARGLARGAFGAVPWAVWLERPRPAHGKAGWSPRVITSGPVRAVRTRVLRSVLRAADRVIAIGSAAKREYAALADLPEERLRVLPYCCDVSRYEGVPAADAAAARREYGLEGRVVFLFSGQMIARKGVDTAIDAFAEVAGDHPEAALLLLGEGPDRAALEGRVPHDLRDRVRFAGFLPQARLPAVFSSADAFLFPSRHDGWGVVLNEACGAGLPVVATPQTGAAHDLVIDGETGFLRERDDVQGFAEAMRRLIQDADLRVRMGAAARRRVARFGVREGAGLMADHVSGMIAGAAAC